MAVNRRSDQEWLDDLSGKRGVDNQAQAFDDLSRYLFVVAYNYLLIKRQDKPALAKLNNFDLGAKGEDFVQEVLENLTSNNFTMLKAYKKLGRFTSYMAVITKRHIDQTTARREYTEYPLVKLTTDGEPGDNFLEFFPHSGTDDISPETMTLRKQTIAFVNECLKRLSELQRQVFLAREISDLSSKEIAAKFDRSVGAIHQNYRYARLSLAECLRGYGVDSKFLATV